MPNLTLYCYAPNKRKDCFLAAGGFLVCGRSAEDLGKGEEKEINRARRTSCLRKCTRKFMSMFRSVHRLDFELELWKVRETWCERKGCLFGRWKLIRAMSTKCSTMPHWCKLSLIHPWLIELSQLSEVCGPLVKARAKVYIHATLN